MRPFRATLPTTAGEAAAIRMPCLAHIPGGPARIGCDDGFADEAPAHLVDVSTFAIGIDLVTNRDYAIFLADTSMPRPSYWGDAQLNHADQPVVGVTWGAVQVYCRWLTARLHTTGLLSPGQLVRLPSEEEWEKAASWNPLLQRAQRYPWGDCWDASRAITAATGTAFPLSIGGRPHGASAYGVQDMLGNVWEWTASIYASYVGAAHPFIESNHYTIRGGSCTLRPTHLRCSFRCRLPSDAWRYHLGFRIIVAAPLS